jgi:hypothetical protein
MRPAGIEMTNVGRIHNDNFEAKYNFKVELSNIQLALFCRRKPFLGHISPFHGQSVILTIEIGGF